MNSLTKGNETKLIMAFALPLLIGNIFQQLYSMADTIIVGRFISGQALAAVGTALPLVNFLLSVIIGLTTGASILISQFFGAGQYGQLRRTVSTSIVFLSILGLLVAVVGYALTPLLFRLMQEPEDIFDDAVTYMRIQMLGMLFPVFYNIFTSYMRALGDTRRPLYILMFATLLNVALDILFITQLRMGVAGAAWATIICQGIAALLTYLCASRYIPLLHVSKLVFDRGLFRLVLRYSVPAAVQLSITSLAMLTITRLVNSFGSVQLAGYTAAVRIDQLAIMPLSNLSMAISTFVAQNMGAGEERRAHKGLRSTMLMMVAIALAISALAFIFGRQLIAIFVSRDEPAWEGIVSTGQQYLMIIAAFYVLFAVFFAFNGFFRGAGDAVIVMILTITSLAIRNICAYFLVGQFDMGPEAVAWAIPVGWGLCSLFCVYYYKKRLWAGKVAVAPVEQE